MIVPFSLLKLPSDLETGLNRIQRKLIALSKSIKTEMDPIIKPTDRAEYYFEETLLYHRTHKLRAIARAVNCQSESRTRSDNRHTQLKRNGGVLYSFRNRNSTHRNFQRSSDTRRRGVHTTGPNPKHHQYGRGRFGFPGHLLTPFPASGLPRARMKICGLSIPN